SADSSWAVSAYGGSIIPSGDVAVAVGASQTFTITPNAGFRIAEVKVDEVSAGAISSKTFTNVMSNHVIAASFVATSYSLSIA
ncbi:MAG: hypothetical protein NTY64_21400, partial [Deltaproteobacteria bacterium]|nr:hypothetical protein [Deltaproteobacteria bacterium]